MSSLALLPASTVHRIASSQVITSVSTAIKELVENALDAGADNVEVKLEEHGLSKIEVRDNGCGIKRDDAQVMAQRYYTSKINCFENLSELTTYGFRGEALCSLCAVSNVLITTKTKDNAVGICYTLGQSGKVLSTKPVPSSTGTTVVVTNLFKNLPVRKQFLSSKKKCKEELKKIEDLVMSFGCIHPEVRLVLWHNKSIIWQKGKVNDYKTAMVTVLGSPVMAHMDKVEYEDEEYGFQFTGYLPKMDSDPSVTCRANNDRCFIFINDRPVMVKEIAQLIKELYASAGSRYPIVFLSIKLPPNSVDVNLEPNKTRVLLTEKEEILDAIKTVLEKFYKKEMENPKDSSNLNTEEGKRCKTMGNVLGKNSSGSANVSQGEEILGDHGQASFNSNKNATSLSKAELVADDFNMNDTFNPLASSTQSDACTIENGNEGLDNLSLKEAFHKNCTEIPKQSYSPTEINSVSFGQKQNSIEHVASNQIESSSNSLSGVNTHYNDDKVEGVNDVIKEQNCKVASTSSTGICLSAVSASANTVQDCDKSKSILESNGKTTDKNYPKTDNTHTGLNPGRGSSFNASNKEKTISNESCRNSILSFDKEDINNMYKLLDMSLKENQISHSGEETLDLPIPPSQQCQPPLPQDKDIMDSKDSSFQLDSVFDDLEFDEILKDLADKKIASQSSQSTQSSERISQTAASKVKDMVDLTTGSDKVIGSKEWSMGNILKDKQNNLVEPTKLLTPSSVKPVDQNKPLAVPGKRKHSVDKSLSLKRNKKIKQVNQVANQSLITVHASQTPQQRYQEAKKVMVPFSMSSLKSCNANPRRSTSSSSKHQLIGRVDPSGVWLMLRGEEICFINQYRIQEQVLFHKLMQTHSLNGDKLEKAIQLEPRLVGGEECWTILTNLESQDQFLDSARVIIDERIKSNGFDIRVKLDPDTEDLKILVTGITTSLPFYGIPDLAEILGLIKDSDPKVSTLSECRPLKVINYLKGEAVRVCRGLSSRMCREDIERTLTQMDEYLPKHVTSCLHHKPFTGHVANIPNLS